MAWCHCCSFSCIYGVALWVLGTSLVVQRVKHLPTMQETWVRSLGWEDPLAKEMATHSSTLAWKIPWTEKPGRLFVSTITIFGFSGFLNIFLFLGLPPSLYFRTPLMPIFWVFKMSLTHSFIHLQASPAFLIWIKDYARHWVDRTKENLALALKQFLIGVKESQKDYYNPICNCRAKKHWAV